MPWKNIYLKEIPLVEALEIYVQSHYEAVITYRKWNKIFQKLLHKQSNATTNELNFFNIASHGCPVPTPTPTSIFSLKWEQDKSELGWIRDVFLF